MSKILHTKPTQPFHVLTNPPYKRVKFAVDKVVINVGLGKHL